MSIDFKCAATVKASRKSMRARNRSGAVHRYTPKAYNTDNFEFSAKRCQKHQQRAKLKKQNILPLENQPRQILLV